MSLNGRRRIRVLCVECNEDGTVGGTHQALLDLARQLDKTRFEFIPLYYQQNRIGERLRELGFQVVYDDAQRAIERAPHIAGNVVGKIRSILRAPLRRAQLLRELKIDIVHMINSPTLGHDDWLPAARLAGIPIVAHCMGPYEPPGRAVTRWLSRRYDRVLSISRFVSSTLTTGGMPADRIQLVYLGVDIAALRARVTRPADEVRRALGLPLDRVLVLMLGNIKHWKGQDVVLDALAAMEPAARDLIHVVFVGATGPGDRAYARKLHETVEQQHLEGNVTFAGGRSDVPDIINAADIVVHASRIPEPFGLVVTEGMALGRPVVATHFGGPAEVLTMESGVTYDPTKPRDLARILTELASDGRRRASLGAAARLRAEQFDARLMTNTIESVYEELVLKAGSATKNEQDERSSMPIESESSLPRPRAAVPINGA
jgi:glycosyltransferase involved in cell wall biosynthesis